MDAIDRQILAELQRDGRQSVTELAARIQLSVSPCLRRLRELERSGVIAGYRAVVDPTSVGLGFEAILFITLDQVTHDVIVAFESRLQDVPAVVTADRIFGEPDYMIRVVTKDLATYQALYDDTLATLPGVRRMSSTLVMKSIVAARPLPIVASPPA